MEWIISTRREGPYWGPENLIESSRTVTTLTEAQTEAVRAVIRAEPIKRTWSAHRDAAQSLSIEGGVIGPLPDGTVIEVRPA
jgi:hypothetical protein